MSLDDCEEKRYSRLYTVLTFLTLGLIYVLVFYVCKFVEWRESRKTKILVVGFGTVGSAVASGFARFKHDISVYDPLKGYRNFDGDFYDFVFICTSEKDVETALRAVCSQISFGTLVIKSTLDLTQYRRITRFYGHVCVNPEFLREATAKEDFANPDRIIIGACCREHEVKLLDLYSRFRRPIFLMTPNQVILSKLVSNACLATLISFWNEIDLLCKRLGFETRSVVDACTADSRISGYGTAFFGAPFSGKCLPKDLDKLLATFERSHCNSLLLEATRNVNKRIMREKQWVRQV